MQLNLSFNQYKYKANPWLTLLALVLVYTMLKLGLWQQHRAAAKYAYIESAKEQSQHLPIDLLKLEDNIKQKDYTPVHANGSFLKPVYLLDNQQYQGKIGFHVLMPFMLSNEKIILVNRGFIERPAQRTAKLSQNFSVTGLKKITGVIKYPMKNPLLLGVNQEQQANGYTILQTVNINELTNHFHHELLPFIFNLTDDTLAFSPIPRPEAYLTPERHQGYALQWYSLAAALIIIYFVLTISREKS